MTVLVTGGSGLVGSHVIEALRARGIAVRALSRPPAAPAVRALGAEVVTGDVTDAAAWRRAADGGLEAIVHAAAIVQQPDLPLAGYEAVNVGGTRLAVETARATRARLVQVSSVAVYGGSSDYRPQPERRTEDDPFRPLAEQDFYARTKRASEALVAEAALRGDITAIAIRPNVIYGERDRLFIHRLVRAIRGRIVPQIGPGTNHLSCVYAGNVAAAKKYLSYFQGSTPNWSCADQRLLRSVIPENRLRVYDVHAVVETLCDTGSVLELRPEFGVGIVTALANLAAKNNDEDLKQLLATHGITFSVNPNASASTASQSQTPAKGKR